VLRKLGSRARDVRGHEQPDAWLNGRMQGLAEWLVEVRKPKAVTTAVEQAVDAAAEALATIVAAHPMRFHSDPGFEGHITSRARELLPLLDEDRRMREVRREQAEENRVAASEGDLTRSLDDAVALLPRKYKPASAQYFAFQAVDAGLDAEGIAMLEALIYWRCFAGLALEIGENYPLYTDDAPRSASGAQPRDKAIGRWAEAIRALHLDALV